jgi:hypothetical protein
MKKSREPGTITARGAGLHKIFYFLGPQSQRKYFLHANTGNLMFKFDH